MHHAGQPVLRLRTHGSVYHLAFLQGTEPATRLAVLQGSSEGVEGVVEGQSSDPRIGGRSLWDVPVPSWIGQRLVIGSVTTAPVEGVAREMDSARAQAITSTLHAIAKRLGAPIADRVQSVGSGHGPAWSAETAVVELELAAVHLCSPTVQRLASDTPQDSALLERVRGAIERSRRALVELAASIER